jgi:DNA-binding NarL/FixJ family response regulator
VAAEHEQLHFLLQEARIAVPILALADRFDAGRVFIREQVVPRLSSRLQAYFRVLTEGETYPTDVSLGPPQPAGVATSVLPLAQNEHMSPEEVRGVESLTEREREVLKLIALGMSNKVIAGKMFITEKTVKTHANHVFRKLGVSSRVQAMLVFQSYQRARRRRPARRP